MNICLVSRELYPFQKAGIGVYINNLTKSLTMNDHNVYIITSKENEIEYTRQSNNRNSNVTVIGVDLRDESLLFEDFNLAYSYGVYNTINQLIIKCNIDLIEFADYFGEAFFSILYKKARGEFSSIPFIVKLHTPTYECNLANEIKEPVSVLTFQEDYTISNVDYVCAISYHMKDTIARRLQRTDIEVVYNMIDSPNVEISEKNLFPILQNRYALFVGRLEQRKGIDLFIKAAVKYLDSHEKNINFVIIGQNVVNPRTNKMMKDELMELIPKEMQEYFIWKQPMPQEDLIIYYKHAYVSVFPSRFEGFGNVCVEAMKMGSPVIVSNNTAMIEIIDNGTYGISFINGDYNDLCIKMTEFLNDEQRRNRLSCLSIERAEDFSLTKIYPEQIQYYKDIKERFKTGQIKETHHITEIILLKNIDRIQYFYTDNQRLADEWNRLAEINEQRVDQINKLDQENKRIIGEWENSQQYIEQLKEENQHRIDEIIKLNQENQRILGEWETMVLQLERKTIELDELQQKLQSGTFLVKQLVTRKRGNK